MRFFIAIYLSMAGLLLGQSGSVPAGTMVEAKLETAVKTASSEVGDTVLAVLTKPVVAADKIMVPGGSRLHGRVETIQAATRTNEGRVRLVFREIQLPDGKRISTWLTNSFVAPTPKRAARYVVYMGIGAAGGAAIGGKRARVAGVLGGLLAGFVIAGNHAGQTLRDLTLKEGQQIRLQLGEDLKIAD